MAVLVDEKAGEADLIPVTSVILDARMQVRLLQQKAVNQIQDIGCSSGHDDERYRLLNEFSELLGKPRIRLICCLRQ